MDYGMLKKDFDIVIKFSAVTIALVFIDQVVGLLQRKYISYVTSSFNILFNNTNFSEIMSISMYTGNSLWYYSLLHL